MRRAALNYSDQVAVISGDRQLSYTEAWDRGLRMANGLLDLGLRPGDRVAVLEDNTLEAQDFFAGTTIAGLVRVPLYARDSREAHMHNLRHTQCRALVVSPKYYELVKGLEDAIDDLDHILLRDEKYEDWLASQTAIDPDVPLGSEDLYIIRHTGGTTGRAKGVANTHRTWLAACRDWTYALPPIAAGDSCLHVGPISHGSGYLYTPMWLQGACNILVEEVNPDAVLEIMRKLEVNYMFAVPTLLSMLASRRGVHPENFPKLKAILIAGAPITDRTAIDGCQAFGPVLHQLYGQTEALPATFMGPNDWFGTIPGSNPLRSAGRPLPFAELEIRDPQGTPLPTGEEGEIAIRCDGQMDGYWDDDELTHQKVVDGWVLTGDIGTLDQNGFLYVLDRKDDMIISGGYNIWPAELENAIASHPAVQEVAVVGVPHEKWGETPLAICVVDPEAKVDEKEIIELCVTRLGSYKKPTAVVFTSETLPKSPVGKLQRKKLREPYWPQRDRRVLV
ncbi:AMP-binding protein [Rhodococcus sp. ABRD24]|uniref:class I adenylate-forming enzyme family protein n=1 Tax=Rhodococcus sp. ABRD24 TaxID=2507582 RepID=UPI001F616823|nr:AMP-binding protein [Rhodococcus sp. ABRD24]